MIGASIPLLNERQANTNRTHVYTNPLYQHTPLHLYLTHTIRTSVIISQACLNALIHCSILTAELLISSVESLEQTLAVETLQVATTLYENNISEELKAVFVVLPAG